MRLRSGIRSLVLYACLLALFVPLTYAAPEDYEGRRITSLRFDPPQQPVADIALTGIMQPLAVGEQLSLAAVRGVIEALFATGRYEDISVDAQPSGPDGVALVLITQHATFIRNVEVFGVEEPPNQGQLVNASKMQLGSQFSEAHLKQAVESLLEALRVNGYYQSKVTPSTSQVGVAQQVDVRFDVNTGSRARFSLPVIKGEPGRSVDSIVKSARWKHFFFGWKPMTEARVTQGIDGIRRSYQKRDYLMAKVALDQMQYNDATNRVTPVLSIEQGPKVTIRTTGSKVSKGKLRQLVPIYQEQTVDKDLLVESARNLETFFESQGYFEAQVEFDTAKNGNGEQVIEFAIARGERHKLTTIDIKGNKYFDTDTLRERMYLTPAKFPQFRFGRYSQDYVRRDVNAIRDLYRANGFRDVDVEWEVADDVKNENELAVYIKITEGPQWFVSTVELDGVSQENMDDIRGLLQSSEGQPFSEYNVATDQDSILNYYFNSGYPDATFDAIVRESPNQPTRMDLRYVVRQGERQYVRDVLVSGLKTTDPQLVRERIRDLDPGDPLAQSSMIESQRRLYDLGIFARVDAAMQNLEGDTKHKYVLYRLEEARKYSVTFGFGAQIARIGGSTNLDAPAGTAGFSPRLSLGVSRSNLMGLGHTLGINTRWSNLQRRAVLSYIAPQFKGNENVNLTFTGIYDDSRDVRTFNARRAEGSIQLGQRLTKANSIQYRIGYRRVTVDQNSLQIDPGLIPILSQPVQLGLSSFTFIQDRRDDPTDARRGMYNTFDGALAANPFGTNTVFTRMLGRNATYHRLSRDLVLARSFSFGLIAKLSERDVPLPERFFAGGGGSHRGFSDNQAGPRDLTTGFPIGGKALLLNNLELRFPLLGENIGGVFFHDAGNVFSKFSSISFRTNQRNLTDFDYMLHAVGFGIRYRTPIGPVRVDLAYSMNPPRFVGFKGTREELFGPPESLPALRREQQLSHIQFHFSLGQTF